MGKASSFAALHAACVAGFGARPPARGAPPRGGPTAATKHTNTKCGVCGPTARRRAPQTGPQPQQAGTTERRMGCARRMARAHTTCCRAYSRLRERPTCSTPSAGAATSCMTNGALFPRLGPWPRGPLCGLWPLVGHARGCERPTGLHRLCLCRRAAAPPTDGSAQHRHAPRATATAAPLGACFAVVRGGGADAVGRILDKGTLFHQAAPSGAL